MGGGASVRNIGPYLAAALRHAGFDLGRAGRRDGRTRLPKAGRPRCLDRVCLVRVGMEGRMKTALNLLPRSTAASG